MGRRIYLACAMLALLGGCVPAVDTEKTNEEMQNDLLQDPSTTAGAYTGRAYLVGTIGGVLGDELAASITFTPYDGVATDAPIFIAATAFDGLTDEQKAGLVAAFEARVPILLVNGDAETINRLIDLFRERFDFAMPGGCTYAEIFAVDLEADGDVYHWALYPPAATEDDPDGTGDQQARVNMLVEWLKVNGQRDEAEQEARAAATAKLQSAAAAAGQELTELSSAFVKQDNFTQYGNNYQISHYVYGCHSMTTGEDWIYVQQRCLFYAGGAYKGKFEWYGGGAGAAAYWYLDTINLDTSLKGFDYDAGNVGLQQSSPETANNVTQVTSGVSWNIGGEVSVSKDGPAATISGGVTISNSTTVNIQDCNALNQSGSRVNNAAWSYQFKKCDTIAYFLYADVSDPPKLATTTFQPLNQWIWRMSPTARAASAPMHVKFNVALVGTTGMVDFYWTAHPWQQPLDGGSWEYDVPFAYPAIAQ